MSKRAIIFAITTVSILTATAASAADPPKAITNSIGMKLVRIEPGAFMMGSPPSEEERDDKEELHEVVITRPFYMGMYEVTQEEFAKGGEGVEELSRDRSVFEGENRPVENIEWTKAKLFCRRLSSLDAEKAAGRTYRLPTEAEWEYACRAGTKTAFHYGDALSSHQANFNGAYPAGGAEKGPYLRKTADVGSYEPNAFGLYDMHGNVAEWCADWYAPDYYLDSPVEDPLGPPLGVAPTPFTNNGKENFYVVVRGGCWVDDGRACRSAYRYRAMPNTQYRLIGFRVVCEMSSDF